MKTIVYNNMEHQFPDDATDDEIAAMLEGVDAPSDQPQGSMIDRFAGVAARGLTPNTAGALVGGSIGLLGGPAAPLTVPAGALVGSMALPAADAMTQAYNFIGQKFGLDARKLPGDVVQELLTQAGYPEAETTAEKVVQFGGDMLSGSGMPIVAAEKTLPLLERLIPKRMQTRDIATLSSRELDNIEEAGTGQYDNILTRLSKDASRAENVLYKDMIDAGWTPERIQAKLKQLGPDATLADLAPFANRAETVAQYPSGAKEASRSLIPREIRMKSDLLTAVDKTLTPENYYKSIDDLKTLRSEEGKILRAEAIQGTSLPDYNIRAKALATSDLIQRLMPTPEFQAGLRHGAKIINLESARTGVPIPKSETWYHGKNFNDPDIQIIEAPTIRMMDAAKQGFDQILKPFENKYTGKMENLGPYEVEVDKARKALVEEMRRLDPKYAKYLDKWADSSEMVSAIERGKDVLKNDPEITKKMLEKISPDNREYTQIGLAKHMRDLIDKNPHAALRLFDKGRSEKNMQLVFGSKQAYNLFKQQTLRKIAQHRTLQTATRNSATVRRELGAAGLEEDAASAVPDAVGIGVDVALGNKVGLFRRGAKWVGEKLSQQQQPKVADELAPVLFSKDPVTQQRVIQRLRQRSGLTIDHDPNDRLLRGMGR